MGTSNFGTLPLMRCTLERSSIPRKSNNLISRVLSSSFKHNVPTSLKETSVRLLDAFVDLVYEFKDLPRLPSQANFAPVEEREEAIVVYNIQGIIPHDFPEGVYLRNGGNPIFGGLKIAESVFGKSSQLWVEGEGMIHAMYFKKDSNGHWNICYNNKHVQTGTFEVEKHRKRPAFLPTAEGDLLAVLSAILLNSWRFGKLTKEYANTSCMMHSGRVYAITENHLPFEIDISTLQTLGSWDVNGGWTRPFTSHAKKAPRSGELVTMGFDHQKPFFEVGIISADGQKVVHKADLKFNRSTFCHEIGVTLRYNVILDFPLLLDARLLINGKSSVKYDSKEFARIGVMPRHGDADSVTWFEVEPCVVFHILNCYEEDNEVVVIACRAPESILSGPDHDFWETKNEWFSKGFKHMNGAQGSDGDSSDGLFFTRVHEWRLNIKTGQVKSRFLTGFQFSMDFPFINEHFTGLKNQFGYAQVVDSNASSTAGMAKYGGIGKLHLEEGEAKELINVEYHMLPQNTFCTGAVFVAKADNTEEDDGWIVTFVHDENTNKSQVYMIDAKHFSKEPIATITLPCRVPYGFHGTFITQNLI
ncbi:PREDICTED: carotenoid 9,10(9',10')-cleavage dioxygenase 1-like isoform X2 [Ipomoea nil]|uniref:carotenoid 9,10(9',10')-cleavage dioxygenase 1-like isoform X2 n=1 Tax=Ipomoea nil TaxID=35883 RepID=UPI0009015944|nr:PREDICTED: carotenoid 9,10(9',10')-cleavage dioxygenase 1-like isoform X2 [Ipomoea nil]